MWRDVVAFFEANMFACPSKKYLGLECMGCGMQRSFVLLLKGELGASIAMYPALLPMLLMFVFLALHVRFQFKNGAYVLLGLFLTTVLIVLIHFSYKLFFL